MFERFTQDARAAVVGAQAGARELGHDTISAQHLLLGLLDAGGVAATVLARIGVRRDAVVADLTTLGRSDAQALDHLGIDLDAVRRQVEASFGRGALERPARTRAQGLGARLLGDHLPFGADAKKALEQALREAKSLQHSYLGTEHLLLALTAEENGPVAATFSRLAVVGDHDTLRDLVLEELTRTA